MKKISLFALLACTVLFRPLTASALDVHPAFNPNLIIPDAAFTDTKTFGGPQGIQRFLESKGSVLANTAPDFLAKLGEPDSSSLKQALEDPEPNLGRLRTAAELIWDASQLSGLNPQIILVTLQKEQSLISGSIDQNRLQRALNHAMGFDCPDNAGCGNLFPGFYYQLFGNVDTEGNRYLGAVKALMRSFSAPEGRGPNLNGAPAKIGDRITLENTLGDYIGILKQQPLTLSNRATAALYRYTPHVFNGNYNFWKFFTSWFKYANGTLLTSSQDGRLFIIQNGTKQPVPDFVATSRGLQRATATTASPTELDSYPLGTTYAPVDNTIINVNGTLFVFLDGTMHPASSFALTQRKLDPNKSVTISLADADLFPRGSQLTPSEGTVLRGVQHPDVYLVDHGVLKRFSIFTFTQRNVAKQVKTIPDAEIALYTKQGYVIPLNGTVIQAPASADVYLINEERRLPLTPDLFKNLGFTQKDIVRLTSNEEFSSIPIGPPAAPREGTYFSISGSQEFYLFKDGAKHLIPSFVAKQRRITPDYAFDASIISNWPDGIAIAPKDNTLIQSTASSTIYLALKGQLHPLTQELFTNLGFSKKNIVVLPESEVSILPKGDMAPPRENTFFTVKETKEFYVFRDGAKRRIYPFVAAQRSMTPDYTFAQAITDTWPSGAPLPPRDGTLVKSTSGSTIYLVSLGKLRPLSTSAFKRRGYTNKQVKTIPKTQLDSLPKGTAITK